MNTHRLYRVENLINGKFYYGVHKLSNKGYFGGGSILKKAMLKHGKENFIMRTIKSVSTEDEAYDLEEIMVDQALVDNPNCYNVVLGGKHRGGPKLRPEESISVKINGIGFVSHKAAARHFNVSDTTIRNNVRKHGTTFSYEERAYAGKARRYNLDYDDTCENLCWK